MKPEFSVIQLKEQLHNIGIQAGDTLLVHTAFSEVKPIEDGPSGLIHALQDVLTETGTLVMPSMSYVDEAIFYPTTTACIEEMGVVADTFWRQADVLRSDNHHAFSAWGFHAKLITQPHPLTIPHGLHSPVGRVYQLGGKILLLGVDQTANTTIHLAEDLAGVRYRCQAELLVLQDGQPTMIQYEEINHCCQNFVLVDEWLMAQNLIQHAKIGYADARLMSAQDLINTVVPKLKANETTFLHEYGVDEECDEARASIPHEA